MSDNEDDFDEGTTPDALYKPSFVLIAIDTHPSMFVKSKNEETGEEFSPFKGCVDACYEVANSLIFTQNKRSWSPFAVVLAAEDDKASFINFNNNVLDSIKFLKQKRDLTNEDLVDNYQRKGDFNLASFFLFCKKKFKEISSIYYQRTIIFITNDDDPVAGDKTKRFTALNEAKNFDALDINFQVVTMNKSLDYTIFYNELFSLFKTPMVEEIIEDKEGLVEKLSSSILVRFSQRKLLFFPFHGDQSRFLRVVQKKFIQETKLYNNAYVSSDGKAVKKITKSELDQVKSFVLKHQDGIINFDMQEHFDIKHTDLPIGYTLLYVSNRVTDVGFVMGDSPVLEVDFKEELPFFNSFWQYCVDRNKVLVCVRKLKFQDNIRFVEFIPKFANNTRLFMVKLIPFMDEISYPPTKLAVLDEELNVDHPPEKVKITNELINKLTYDYDPRMFINPAFAKKKAFLRAKLLDEPVEEFEDPTLGNDGIDTVLDDVGDRFKSLFNLQEEGGKKRKAPAKSSRAKKAK